MLGYAKAQGVGVTHVALTVGTNFPDGLSAGAYLAKDSGLLLLTPSTYLPVVGSQALMTNKATIKTMDALGGTSSVGDAVLDQSRTALQ